eukprot:m.342100 g.342100  ORF g.342100 m.342100 type:complete len:447 (-) comp16545_c0_seq67:975-2315(-)
MAQPSTHLRDGELERFAAALQDRATQQKLHVNNRLFVHVVSIAVPRRIPQELSRFSILRLALLGEGNYGEVYKANVSLRGSVSLTTAVKTLKTSDASARTFLLKEGALMALFDHHNILSLLGVVTVPRDMPALLVLEYCENGTLLEHVRENGDFLDASMLLTFCHDVAMGMHYLSSRRIVHRDIAARNILVDATCTCKVSDFGMSEAVSADKDGSDYAANYVKLAGGELPVRWSAIEVLMDTKYSKASDVWSFGVLVYEVMTLGQLPYCEFATLAEAAEQIKAGYVMPCPDVCHNDVHTSVMLPCWSRNPSDRPGFGTLCEVLVQHGAIPAQVANASSATTSVEPPTKGYRKKWSKTKITKADRLLLGPSIHHIQNVLAPRVIAQPPWRDGKGQMILPECATIAHAVAAVVKPAGAKTVCPRDGQMGRPTLILSESRRTWNGRVRC